MKAITSRWLRALPLIAVFFIVLLPWSKRLQSPNIIGDDVQRVIDLQTLSLAERMARPFNEHLAPMFELLTAAIWEGVGRRLENVPLAFTLASYLPFVLSLGMLFFLARREWRSPTVAMVAVILFAATPIYAECVLWFSASTFTWALLFILVGLWLAGQVGDHASLGCAVGAAAVCFFSPMGSAIGLLAGPVATIRAWPARQSPKPIRAVALALAPILGTLANIVGASLFRYHDVVARSVRSSGDIGNGLVRAVQAPLYLILTGYGRVADAQTVVPYSASVAFLLVGLTLVMVTAWRNPGQDRRWLAIGSFLIVFGYTMIYCFRTLLVGLDSLVTVQRYHLLPCLGLVLILTTWAAPQLRRLDGRPFVGPIMVVGLAMTIVAINGPLMSLRTNYYRIHPNQQPTLAMLNHVADAARSRGFSRNQVLRVFEPLEPRWTFPGGNILKMLPQITDSRFDDLNDAQIRSTIAETLSVGDRSILFADINVTGLLQPRSSWNRGSDVSPGHLVSSRRIQPLDRPGFYRVDGLSSYLEFTFPASTPLPRALSFIGLGAGKTLEIWWADEQQRWSSDHRIILRLNASAGERSDWVLPLDRLPNMRLGEKPRIRIAFRGAGQIALGTPALFR